MSSVASSSSWGYSEENTVRRALCNQRLLRDINELTKNPYPNIKYHVRDSNLTKGCLILTPENHKPLHITVHFSPSYPIDPPSMRMDSKLIHPNIYGTYICSTILRRTEEYTPAYTFKAICIQMLSFFGSESLEQEDSGETVSLEGYKRKNEDRARFMGEDDFECGGCRFKAKSGPTAPGQAGGKKVPGAEFLQPRANGPVKGEKKSKRRGRGKGARDEDGTSVAGSEVSSVMPQEAFIDRLPDELLLQVLGDIEDFEHLTALAQAWPRISQLIKDFDLVRQHDLQCFTLKRTYKDVKLGVGVSAERGRVASEFDLLSKTAFQDMSVHSSVHNIDFSHWLPLPLSWKHWRSVRGDLDVSLVGIKAQIRGAENAPSVAVLYHFMSDIVVRLNEVAQASKPQRNWYAPSDPQRNWYAPSDPSQKSTLRHASEKAIESYFHLFHILVCMACEDSNIVTKANALLQNFMRGQRSKKHCPNLAHLLVALLISDIQITDELYKAIITEAITRNVVWMLDTKGANMPQLAFLESDEVSHYRLTHTFQASLTSYRLLMFSELFRRTARPPPTDPATSRKTLPELRDELFQRHGAPPRGAAAHLASEVRRLHGIDNFPSFLKEMGLRNIPTAANFTSVLRGTLEASVKMGYSRWAMSQEKTLCLRMLVEPTVGAPRPEMKAQAKEQNFLGKPRSGVSWFPENGNGGRGGNEGGRGRGGTNARGRGGMRGRGRGY